MNLSYRGIQYQATPASAQVIETGAVGHYRGATYPLRRAVNAAQPHPAGLKYRGAEVH
ncbi:DUF4278 domain-containing protein [Romeria aff. gracilis LEGE 07310]|uniref:DUF4278 domain-containing protein n=1 Tax=Vasconcelosia minhoensis LEGE 07310 TaxID=915328 RepID=A0A8J7DRH6_9CYAN|nr:DUF4278 domain-containing protein [Romeria gracilis]MBE9078559.1 DUF4278 domain-containing protein [Romeria aff. gracilis LEGE 07310]